MITKHTMRATIPHGDPDIGAEVDAQITFTYSPGSGDTYDPSRGGPGGWDPGYAAEVELIKAEPFCNGKPSPYYGAFADLEYQNLQDIAQSWLEGDGYTEAVEHAEYYRSGPDPDVARDARIDDELMERGR